MPAVLAACCRTKPVRAARGAGGLLGLSAGRAGARIPALPLRILSWVDDLFGTTTRDVLERAMTAYRDAGNVTGEIAAIGELAAVYRIQGRAGDMLALFGRVAELDATGHGEAAGLMALVRLSSASSPATTPARHCWPTCPSVQFPQEEVVAYRIATTRCRTLGDEEAMMTAARADLAGASTMRHVLAPSPSGTPAIHRPALAALAAIIVDAGRSALDGRRPGCLATMVKRDERPDRVRRRRSSPPRSGPLPTAAPST